MAQAALGAMKVGKNHKGQGENPTDGQYCSPSLCSPTKPAFKAQIVIHFGQRGQISWSNESDLHKIYWNERFKFHLSLQLLQHESEKLKFNTQF